MLARTHSVMCLLFMSVPDVAVKHCASVQQKFVNTNCANVTHQDINYTLMPTGSGEQSSSLPSTRPAIPLDIHHGPLDTRGCESVSDIASRSEALKSGEVVGFKDGANIHSVRTESSDDGASRSEATDHLSAPPDVQHGAAEAWMKKTRNKTIIMYAFRFHHKAYTAHY